MAITATLIRGKKYSYNQILKTDAAGVATETKFHAFERNIPVPVDEVLAGELEELVEIIPTSEGDEIEKPRFNVNWEAPEAGAKAAPDPNKKVRMRLVAADDVRSTQPKPRPKPKGLYNRTVGR